MKTNKLVLTTVSVVGITWIALRVLTFAQPQDQAPIPPVTSTEKEGQSSAVDVESVSSSYLKSGLEPLLIRLETTPGLRLPAIHTLPYCQSSPKTEECTINNKFGLELHKAILKYQVKMIEMKSDEFSTSFRRLALLRDRLWENKSLGNILLADLIDRVMFGRMLDRIAHSTPSDLDKLEMLRVSSYKQMVLDWKSVAQALTEEYGVPLSTETLQTQPLSSEVNSYYPAYARINRVYGKMWELLEDKNKLGRSEDVFDVLDSGVPVILEGGSSRPFLFRYGSSTTVSAFVVARSVFLRDTITVFKNAYTPDGQKVLGLSNPTSAQVEKALLKNVQFVKALAPQIFKGRPVPYVEPYNIGIDWYRRWRIAIESSRKPLEDDDLYYGKAGSEFF